LHPIALLLGGRGTNDQVLLSVRALNSVCISFDHCGSAKTFFTVVGSVVVRKALGFSLPVLP
jgi:hypothetical protein